MDDQIRDVLIQNTPHAEVRRQCLIDPNASLNDVLKKAQLYVRTLSTDQLLSGGSNNHPVSVNKMSSSYKKSTRPRRSSNSRPQAGKDLKRCPKCFMEHSREKCPYKEAS